MTDAFARGQRGTFPEGSDQWVTVPKSVIDGVVDFRVRGSLRGHTESLQERLSDGRIQIEFVGPPRVARLLELNGDQYIGWTGIVAPEDLTDIEVEEIRRA